MASTKRPVTADSLAEIARGNIDRRGRAPLPEIQARFHERILLDGQRLDGDVTGRLLGARMIRRYDGATSLELDLDDHDWRILTSGLLSRKGKVRRDEFQGAAWAQFGDTRLVLDGVAFRLAGVRPSYGADERRITLVFEDELATQMRGKKGPKRFRRGETVGEFRSTRASAIWQLVIGATPGGNGSFMTAELFDKQPIKGESPQARRKAREKGLAHWRRLKIKNVAIDAGQKRNLETALAVADDRRAPELAVVAMLCAGIGESDFMDVMNFGGSGYGGVFQGAVAVPGSPNWFAGMGADERTREEAESFLKGGRGFQQGGAIKLATDNPDMSPGEIATRVEASGKEPGFYGTYETEARKILDAWGGVGRVKIVEGHFNFTVGKDETYFDAAGRWAQEVNWRFWVDQNTAWYVPDDWLFQSATTLRITPTTNGVRGFNGVEDVGIPVGELVFAMNIPRWVGEPGWRVELDEMGAHNGLWLLAMHEQDLFTEDSTITVRRPSPRRKEPAPERKVVQLTETPPSSGSARKAILDACERAFGQRSKYHYLQTRPMPSSLFASGPLSIDCSAFATLAYKAGGAPDPNGRGYDGLGYTGTLAANGEWTHDPQPGDLAFYGDPASTSAHVNVFAGHNGDGQPTFYNMGPSAGLSKPTGFVRSDFRGYKTYGID